MVLRRVLKYQRGPERDKRVNGAYYPRRLVVTRQIYSLLMQNQQGICVPRCNSADITRSTDIAMAIANTYQGPVCMA